MLNVNWVRGETAAEVGIPMAVCTSETSCRDPGRELVTKSDISISRDLPPQASKRDAVEIAGDRNFKVVTKSLRVTHDYVSDVHTGRGLASGRSGGRA